MFMRDACQRDADCLVTRCWLMRAPTCFVAHVCAGVRAFGLACRLHCYVAGLGGASFAT